MIWYLFFICLLLIFLHLKSNTLIHHTVNVPCFIFSLDHLKEWIFYSLSLRRYSITWPPSLFLVGCWVVYLASLILTSTFVNKSFLFMLSHIWLKNDNNVVLHRLPIFPFPFPQLQSLTHSLTHSLNQSINQSGTLKSNLLLSHVS